MIFKKTKNTDKKGHVGLRWKLFAYLAAFTLLILLALWVLQIRLLGYFYEREKFSELEDAADVIGKSMGNGLDGQVSSISASKNMCIRIFLIEDGAAHQVADAEASVDCMIHHLPSELLADLYDSANEGGGTYHKKVSFNHDPGESEDDFRLPGMHHPANISNAIYVRLIEHEGRRYMAVFDSELTPVTATVNTLQVQFLWISAFLLFAAFLLALVLSRVIATPLAAVTAKARKLAAGNYEADFEGIGYREIEELASTLNFAANEIGATDRLQKELIANISHDLRTPLTMIKGYSELMRDLPGENNAANAQIIIDETTRLSELVNDLLDISKLQAGTKKPEYRVLTFTGMVEETMLRYEALIRHHGYRIELKVAEKAFVRADRTMILQVIYNLINNAVNYTGDSLRVGVDMKILEDRVRLSVTDDGEGISPERIKDIWERYYRVDKVHKRAVMGTGLGLSIVKGILEAHGARYGVDSAVGVGSVFWFELPLVGEGGSI